MPTIRFTGEKRVFAAMRRSANGAQSGSVRAARKLMHAVYVQSQIEVPVETASLKNSGRVVEDMGKRTFKVSIIYGSPIGIRDSSKYAVYVHEDLSKKHAPPTKAKFVEDPLMAAAAAGGMLFKTYVGAAIRTAVGNP